MQNLITSALAGVAQDVERNRLENIANAWAAYSGSTEYTVKDKDTGINLNPAKIIVDETVSFLFGENVTFDLDEASTDRTPEEQYLDAFWAANKKMTRLHGMAMNGAIAGHCFVKIHEQPGMAYPRVIVLDPETVTVTTAADDIDNHLKYVIAYSSIDPTDSKPIGIRQVIERNPGGATWQVTDQRGKGGVTAVTNWVTTESRTWPHAYPPIVECQNLPNPNQLWGIADLEPDLLDLIKKTNFVTSNNVKILKYFAHPKFMVYGAIGAEVNVNPDEAIAIQDVNARAEFLEMHGDLEASHKMIKLLKEAIYTNSRTPEIATGKVENVGALSGLALKVLYMPLIQKTKTKRVTYGDMLVELNRRVLDMAGMGSNNISTIKWQEMLPVDPVTKLQEIQAAKEMGVSNATIMSQHGYDPDLEAEQKAKESDLGAALLRSFDQGVGISG